jgi:hypothetical protein
MTVFTFSSNVQIPSRKSFPNPLKDQPDLYRETLTGNQLSLFSSALALAKADKTS